jgi:regulator-associated protein of mTOR
MTMTAVAVQQHAAHRQQYNPRQSPHSSNMSSPHQSRPQSYTSSGAAQIQRQESPLQNGNSSGVSQRHAVSNDPLPVANGSRPTPSGTDLRSSTSGGRANSHPSDPARDRRASLQPRPTSAPNGTGETSQDDSETDSNMRRPKALLQRSKSDFGPRGEDQDSQADEEIYDWGARHGFEDHYASEEYVSQLANVSCSFLLLYELYLRRPPRSRSF